MIEIIREEDVERTERKELPKDIKQIGKPDIGDRIYVENQVYEYLHPHGNEREKNAYILLGKFENYTGRQCTFVEAAIHLEEMIFEGGFPVWNDQTWAYVYRQLKQEYASMVIVGWALDIKGQLPNLTAQVEMLHQHNFGGIHQILFLMDSLEQEENFYGSRNGHLYRREGFYIYYNRAASVVMGQPPEHIWQNEKNELYSEDVWEEPVVSSQTEVPRGNYRKQMLAREEKQQVPSYATSFLLLVAVCVFGITAYTNCQKMNAMQETLAGINAAQPAQTQGAVTEQGEIEQDIVKVESVAGNVQKENMSTETAVTDESTAEVSATGTAPTVTAPENPAPEDMSAEVSATQETLPESETSATQEMPAEENMSAGAETASTETSTAEIPAETSAEDDQAAKLQAMTEAQTYLAQGYYDVKPGDSLVGICKKIYQTTAMMDLLCEVNEIEDENSIYAGQRLKLPN